MFKSLIRNAVFGTAMIALPIGPMIATATAAPAQRHYVVPSPEIKEQISDARLQKICRDAVLKTLGPLAPNEPQTSSFYRLALTQQCVLNGGKGW